MAKALADRADELVDELEEAVIRKSGLAEVALVGKAPGRYNLHLGGDARGQRLNVLFRENFDEVAIMNELDMLIAAWAQERESHERFGDFLWRTGRLPSAARGAA